MLESGSSKSLVDVLNYSLETEFNNDFLLPVYFDGDLTAYNKFYIPIKENCTLEKDSTMFDPFTHRIYHLIHDENRQSCLNFPSPIDFTSFKQYSKYLYEWQHSMLNYIASVHLPNPVSSLLYFPSLPKIFTKEELSKPTPYRTFKASVWPLLPKNYLAMVQKVLNEKRVDPDEELPNQIPKREIIRYYHHVTDVKQWMAQLVAPEPLPHLYDSFEDYEKAYLNWSNVVTKVNMMPLHPRNMEKIANLALVNQKPVHKPHSVPYEPSPMVLKILQFPEEVRKYEPVVTDYTNMFVKNIPSLADFVSQLVHTGMPEQVYKAKETLYFDQFYRIQIRMRPSSYPIRDYAVLQNAKEEEFYHISFDIQSVIVSSTGREYIEYILQPQNIRLLYTVLRILSYGLRKGFTLYPLLSGDGLSGIIYRIYLGTRLCEACVEIGSTVHIQFILDILHPLCADARQLLTRESFVADLKKRLFTNTLTPQACLLFVLFDTNLNSFKRYLFSSDFMNWTNSLMSYNIGRKFLLSVIYSSSIVLITKAFFTSNSADIPKIECPILIDNMLCCLMDYSIEIESDRIVRLFYSVLFSARSLLARVCEVANCKNVISNFNTEEHQSTLDQMVRRICSSEVKWPEIEALSKFTGISDIVLGSPNFMKAAVSLISSDDPKVLKTVWVLIKNGSNVTDPLFYQELRKIIEVAHPRPLMYALRLCLASYRSSSKEICINVIPQTMKRLMELYKGRFLYFSSFRMTRRLIKELLEEIANSNSEPSIAEAYMNVLNDE